MPASAMSFHEKECKELFDHCWAINDLAMGGCGSTAQWDVGCWDYISEDGTRWIGSDGIDDGTSGDASGSQPNGGYYDVPIDLAHQAIVQALKSSGVNISLNDINSHQIKGNTPSYWTGPFACFGNNVTVQLVEEGQGTRVDMSESLVLFTQVVGCQKVLPKISAAFEQAIAVAHNPANDMKKVQNMSEIEARSWMAGAFTEGVANFLRFFNQSQEKVKSDLTDEGCSKRDTSCEQFAERISILSTIGGALLREDMVFDNNRYIGSKIHVVGIPHVSKAAHFELRKLKVTHPKIKFHFDAKESDEAVLWLGYDVNQMANVLREKIGRDEAMAGRSSHSGQSEVKTSQTVATSVGSQDLEFWQSIKGSDDVEMYQAYLSEFPKGKFKKLAQLKIKKLGIVPSKSAVSSLDYGRYHALVIGNNNYRHLGSLKTAVNDARSVASVLTDDYGFEVQLLENATRSDVIRSLSRLRKTVGRDDNLLVYYAGHGYLDDDINKGYWLPVDADRDDPTNWIQNDTIVAQVKGMQAKHVMVVADSCFSGTITRGLKIEQRTPDWLQKIVKKKARTALTSGGLEPVMDSGGGNHSAFAKAFISLLEENDGVLDASQLFSQLRPKVMLNSPQTPEYGNIHQAGHDGGDFLFVRQ